MAIKSVSLLRDGLTYRYEEIIENDKNEETA